ncbi:MAG: 2-oxoacid:ferredoxin oxidoreductase subunit beta [Rhodospirillales bacterium]|jgi:2-oxoglutarate ferredoxin oxidoreductase subunit beta|nr:2-oxoglutarate synthase [Rhodospirillaceae bacterium]MDP6430544.1 2-oxoacid:ferredoxin oxidoreductase subunit beta [Rhodospirillales bacterium]MDP6643565.1 2-oxoacid:ferredoxin oxidoreductase subunit beta [Rhodospirillales bacterium]MDP6841236.1 2-oxoacid:ferredoxin oxidoreductase subunit beta [Rhodospirillales bacterium]|tara:strand:+ start:1978 stop:2808 length:831 start_codon:yes stop_codon:yes gene_type:complete
MDDIKTEYLPNDYKSEVRPVWCPGCGDFSTLLGLTKALAMLGRDPKDIAVVSGIGCSSRIPAYTNCYGFHGLHGRALPIAAGLKVARPDLTVIVAGGDGDGYSIGGNHFLHACRRNVDMTYIVMDNQVYGMTKGQPSPTTDPEWGSKLAPEGTGVRTFSPLGVALAAGATFIGRSFSGDSNHTAKVLHDAILHPGFAFVEILSPCIIYRPEQREWKNMVHASEGHRTEDRAEAAERLISDDGFTTGVLFIYDFPSYSPDVGTATASMSDIEQEFAV